MKKCNETNMIVIKRACNVTIPLFIALMLAIFCSPFADLEAKVYVDISSPGVKKLPIAIQSFQGGDEISDIIQDDLNFTGLFQCIENAAQIERAEQPFNAANWRGLGVELVVKGRVQSPFSVIVYAYDVSDGKEIIKKEYASSKDLVRPLAHSIANDIYKTLTGQQGVFRTKIAFAGEKDGRRELYLADWDGHRTHGLGIRGDILLAPRWATDGSKLLYSAERHREWGIFILDMNSMREKSVASSRGLNLSGNFFPNNREFVFSSSREGNSDIYLSDSITTKTRKLIASPWIDVSPAVSPDGKHILFVSNRSGSPQIYLADKDGYGIRRLTFQGSYNTAPTWFPSGDKIAYVGMVGGGHQIFVMKLDGTDLSQLTNKGRNEEPCVSPDGRYILFISDRDGTKGVFLMRTDGEGQKRVTPKGLKATSPSWSPF